MCASVPPKISELLKNVLDDGIENYSVTQNSNKKGEGFNGEMYFIEFKHKRSGKVFNFAIKQAFVDERARIVRNTRFYFQNEIYFYEKVWPRLQEFQKEKLLINIFNNIPKCYATSFVEKAEVIILENLKPQNFQLVDKWALLDETHFEYIFKQYGRFHALSFAYKELNPKGYLDISEQINTFLKISQKESYRNYFRTAFELCSKSLNDIQDADIIEKYKKYAGSDGPDILGDASVYKGEYSVILHGDSWSNNMMFKYDENGNPVDLKLLDFQFSYKGSTVSDLSYCLYTSGSKDIFDRLDYYLEIYHKSLTQALKQVGCNPNLYPLNVLKEEWKRYCKVGFISSLLLWYNKLYEATHEDNATDVADGGKAGPKLDEETFRRRTRDIILHMYGNNCL